MKHLYRQLSLLFISVVFLCLFPVQVHADDTRTVNLPAQMFRTIPGNRNVCTRVYDGINDIQEANPMKKNYVSMSPLYHWRLF